MTNLCKWGSTSLQTVLSTEMNSLGNNAVAVSSTLVFDNTSNFYPYADVEVNLPFASGTPTTAMVIVFFLEAVDGTNSNAGDAFYIEEAHPIRLINIPIGVTASTAQRVVARQIPLMPFKAKVGLYNFTGISLPSTGNTVKFLQYGYNFNG